MGALKFGPARIPSRESPEEAIELLLERGYSACEIDFEGKFWMDYDFAARLGELAREHGIALSVHAPSDGAFTSVEPFARVLAVADAVMAPGAPFHVHFSDIQFANRNETKHLPYGEGTLRADPLGEALAQLERPATVITESPDEASHQAIRAALFAIVGESSAHRAS